MGSQVRETEQMLETVGGMACVSPKRVDIWPVGIEDPGS